MSCLSNLERMCTTFGSGLLTSAGLSNVPATDGCISRTSCQRLLRLWWWQMGAAYVDVVYQEDEKSQAFEMMNWSKNLQRGGKSNVMLSYTWHTPVDVIVESLVQFCERHERSTYHTVVWICFACNNVKTHQPPTITMPLTITMPPTVQPPCHPRSPCH